MKERKYKAHWIDIIANPKRENHPLDLVMKTTVRNIEGDPEEEIELRFSYSAIQLKGFIKKIEKVIIEYEDSSENVRVLNDFLKVKLEQGVTNIYVKDKRFNQCKYLLLNIPVDQIEEFDDIKSIDEAERILNHKLHGNRSGLEEFEISPEEEFIAHCSNLQAWVENDYNTAILHRNIAFKLLKELVNAGDPKAKRYYKEDLAHRLESNDIVVTHFLIQRGYLKDLKENELEIILENMEHGIAKIMVKDYLLSNFKKIDSQYDADTMSLTINKEILLTSIERSILNYKNYKRPFNLNLIERYSRYLYKKSMFDFGLTWRNMRVLFKTENLKIASDLFEKKESIMVQIPRGKAPLKLYVKEENLATYIFPKLMY